MNDTQLADKSFEELLELLDQSMEALESDKLTLDEMLQYYERSVRIVSACTQLLDQAEMRVRQIDELLKDDDELSAGR